MRQNYNHSALAEVWADELPKMDWKRFCTFTTQYELTLPSSRRLMERFFDRAKRKLPTQSGLTLFWVAEKFECKDGYHLHGLLNYSLQAITGVEVYDVLNDAYQVTSAAQKAGKRFRVAFNRYDPKRAAAKYCAKYLAKSCADYDFLC